MNLMPREAALKAHKEAEAKAKEHRRLKDEREQLEKAERDEKSRLAFAEHPFVRDNFPGVVWVLSTTQRFRGGVVAYPSGDPDLLLMADPGITDSICAVDGPGDNRGTRCRSLEDLGRWIADTEIRARGVEVAAS